MRERISVVTIGGGTGQSVLLRALMHLPFVDVTAIVSPFDSGGSSRVLRDQYGVLPYGDIQRCIFALSPYEHVRDIFSARITMPEQQGDHTGGNLLLSALEQEFRRSVPESDARRLAVSALERMFKADGRVIPASLEDADVQAVFTDRSLARNEVKIDEFIARGKHIAYVKLKPAVKANPDALEAIEQADVIIIGPGSWYTSVLPPLLPDGMRQALIGARASVVWIVNLFTEGTDMASWSGEHWLTEFLSHADDPERGIARSPRCILVNSMVHEEFGDYSAEGKQPVHPGIFPTFFVSLKFSACKVVKTPLWINPKLARHDEGRLATSLGQILPRIAGDPAV